MIQILTMRVKGKIGYLPIIKLYFKILDDSLVEDNIPLDIFNFSPLLPSYPTGAKIAWKGSAGEELSKDIAALRGKGFAEAEKQIDTVTVKKDPTKTTYEHGEEIDLTGGELLVTYTDGSSETVSMKDSAVSIVSGNPANVNKTTVTLSYKGKTPSFPITINDPIVGLAVKTPMTVTEYNHDTSLNFAGLTLEASKKSGAKIPLTQTSPGVTTSETKADINSPAFTQSSPSSDVEKRGTQVITFTYEGKTATQTIIVNDKVSSIRVASQPTKKVYKAGEALNLIGAVVEVTLESGTKSNINLPDGTVTLSTHNVNLVGSQQQLTVTAFGKTAPETINVEWYDYVTKTELIAPTKSEYDLNEPLDLAGGSLKLTWKRGAITNIPLTSNMITPNTGVTSTAGTKTLTVTHTPEYTLADGTTKINGDTFTKTFEIEVVNNINSITITPPTKTSYKHGENLDLVGGTITLHYADNSTSSVAMQTSMIKEANGSAVNMSPASTEYDSATHKLSKTLKISYSDSGKTGNVDYPIEIIDELDGITVTSTTHKTAYNINDPLDLTNLTISATRLSGDITPSITVVPEMIETTWDSNTAGSFPITIAFTENGVTKKTTYTVTIADQIKSIDSVNMPKKEYKYNEELDYTGATLTITMGSGQKTIPLNTAGVSITGYDKTDISSNPQELTVSYLGLSRNDLLEVNVRNYVTGITVSPKTATGDYNDEIGDIITKNSLTYTINRAKPGTDSIAQSITASMVTAGYDKTVTTAQTPTVSWTDTDTNSATNGKTFTDTFTVTLENSLDSITVTKPNKTTYNYNDPIDLAGGTITLHYKDGSTSPVSITQAVVTEADGTTTTDLTKVPAGDFGADYTKAKTLKVSYTDTASGKKGTVDYPITVINDIQGIAITSTDHKIAYNVNDTLDVSKLKISITRAVRNPNCKLPSYT